MGTYKSQYTMYPTNIMVDWLQGEYACLVGCLASPPFMGHVVWMLVCEKIFSYAIFGSFQ
jgi:hypothetical protein